MGYLKVGKLKELLNQFSDNDDVVIVDPDTRYHLSEVSSVGILKDGTLLAKTAIGLMANTDRTIDKETDHCIKLLWHHGLKGDK